MSETEKKQLIYERMSSVMAEVSPIAKDRQGAGYKFRGIDDVYQALQAILAKHQVFSLPTVLSEKSEERTAKSGAHLIYRVLHIRYTFYTTDGSTVSALVIGEAMDSGDKASNKAMSVAHKYALLQAFCIPTEESKDPENETFSVIGNKNPFDHVYYSGERSHKEELKKVFKELNILDVDKQRNLATSILNATPPVELSKLKEFVIHLHS